MRLGIPSCLFLAAAAPATQPTMDIEARQFLENSGTLTGNLLNAEHEYVGWNAFLAGDGYARGSGNILILVRLANPTDKFVEIDAPLTITAVANGKVLAERRRLQGIGLDKGKSFYEPLWLGNARCAGITTVTARLGDRVTTATLHLTCGE